MLVDTPAIIHPWIQLKHAEARYNPIVIKIIVPIYAKSISPVPINWAMTPSNNLVVAFPEIFGPMIAEAVENIANMNTIKTLPL